VFLLTKFHHISFCFVSGGREVYHQSRARSGRHKHGPKQRHSGDFTQQVAPVSPPEESVNSKRRSTGYLYENHFNEQVNQRDNFVFSTCAWLSEKKNVKENLFFPYLNIRVLSLSKHNKCAYSRINIFLSPCLIHMHEMESRRRKMNSSC
jgi:hypothetical protein